jgi:threonine dehydrogenase-like Zn-dependent dehydrogenase
VRAEVRALVLALGHEIVGVATAGRRGGQVVTVDPAISCS